MKNANSRRRAPAPALFSLHWRKLHGAVFTRNEFAGSGADLQGSGGLRRRTAESLTELRLRRLIQQSAHLAVDFSPTIVAVGDAFVGHTSGLID